MKSHFLSLRKISFSGPTRAQAELNFHQGLNILYGASDTGKSFILEAISFMLGSGSELRDIPERVGYDRIWLSLVRPDGSLFTITRSTDGGDYNLYEGEVYAESPSDTPKVLKWKHDSKKPDNLSSYLLSLVGADKKRLNSKADGTTISLTAAHLRHLCIVSETAIQKQESPILTGQYTTKTPEMAAFKYLLSGVDDSSLIKSSTDSSASQSRQAKLEVIDELITSYQTRFRKLSEKPIGGEELSLQLEKLENTLAGEAKLLESSESGYSDLSTRRISIRTTIERSLERQGEISDLMERFNLLNEHYNSDIRRLEGIQEAGSLVSALAPGECPLCGSDATRPHPDTSCDGNLEMVVIAASAEKEKIIRLRFELTSTIAKLQAERSSFERLLPKLEAELAGLDSRISQLFPSITERRESYQSLVDLRSDIRSLQEIWTEIDELQQRRGKLQVPQGTNESETQKPSELPASVIDLFSQKLEKVLQAWHFPGADRVYFDSQKRDFIISGKLRGSRGKGMRAITHAAFTLALLEFCVERSHPHFGFVVMDTPLLAYREPDAADEGIAETGLNEHFYSYLSKLEGLQIIIIENVDPPDAFREGKFSTRFSGNAELGRAGFFPM